MIRVAPYESQPQRSHDPHQVRLYQALLCHVEHARAAFYICTHTQGQLSIYVHTYLHVYIQKTYIQTKYLNALCTSLVLLLCFWFAKHVKYGQHRILAAYQTQTASGASAIYLTYNVSNLIIEMYLDYITTVYEFIHPPIYI